MGLDVEKRNCVQRGGGDQGCLSSSLVVSVVSLGFSKTFTAL